MLNPNTTASADPGLLPRLQLACRQARLPHPPPHLAGSWTRSPWAGCASRPLEQAGKLQLQFPGSDAIMLHLQS